MLKQLMSAATQLAQGAGSVVGLRLGTEEPPYTRVGVEEDVEIRRYGPRIAAETTVLASPEEARNSGFRALAGYIFGGNDERATIAMTAPVAQTPSPKAGSVIAFYMPSTWTMDTLPRPADTRVQLVDVPAQTLAVLRFSGDRSANAVARQTQKLLNTLARTAFTQASRPVAWFYDPPWTVPALRRNEVAIAVTPV